jgi:hypothetical protein
LDPSPIPTLFAKDHNGVESCSPEVLNVEFIHIPAYSPDFNLAEYEIHLLRLEKLHHLPSDLRISEIEKKLESVKILMNPEQIFKTLEHIFALAPMSIS